MVSSRAGSALVREANFIHLEYEASLIARQIEQSVEVRLESLRSAATQLSPGLGNADPLLSAHRSLLDLFDMLVVISREGEVIADWPVLEGRRGIDVSHREYFSYLKNVRRPYVSEPYTGTASPIPLVMMGVPLFDVQGEFNGILGGAVRVEEGSFFANLRNIRIGENGFAALFTSTGRILTYPNERLIMMQVPSGNSHPILDLALSGWEGAAEGQMIEGEPALLGFRQVWSANWIVGVFLPSKQMLGPFETFIRQLWGVGLITALLMLPLLWWLLKLLLRPLHRLERHIAAVGKGEASRVELYTGMRELKQVADNFNALEAKRGEATSMLKDRQAFLDSVLASSPIGLFVCNLQGQIDYINPALQSLTGYPIEAYCQDSIVHHLHPAERQDILDLWKATLRTGRDFQRQMRYNTASGTTLWLEIHIRQVKGGNVALGYVGTVKDITDSRQREALQLWEAEHDPLTGLLNRRGFERRLEEALVAWQKAGIPSVLLMFDLDHFKPINDEGGHALGDEMLRRIGQVLVWEVRRSDHVARQGGDEFAVLMPSCTLQQAQRVASNILRAINEVSVTHEGREYRISLSMGITAFLEDDHNVDTVTSRADAASYQAKSRGRNQIVLASEEVPGSP
ncbi:diguanylate cyclase [Halomonas sp. PA5]|nr:diguanylate cyclase [Halomonas populi]QJQ97230.1 diguanylate cyclase [Halomonas sp. PA5]